MKDAMSDSLLRLENVSKTFHVSGATHVTALNDISVDLGGDRVVALLGKNGSGKTTFIKCCCNLLTYKGNIFYDNNRLRSNKNTLNRYYAAVLEGNRNLYWKLTVQENIQYFSSLRGMSGKSVLPYAEELLHMLYMYDRKDVLVEKLSRGMQQKTALICAMVLKVPVLFLDEPTLGLDIESKNQMVEFFNKRDLFSGRLIFITSHNLEFVSRVVDEVMIIKDGQILDRFDIDNIRGDTGLIRIVVGGAHSTDAFAADTGIDVVSEKLEGDSRCFVIDPRTLALSEVVSIAERHDLDIRQIKTLSYDLETVYTLAQNDMRR
jgi:ABC-2 type transport system ATP-binding protein